MVRSLESRIGKRYICLDLYQLHIGKILTEIATEAEPLSGFH